MKTFSVTIPEETVNYLQRLHYEVSVYKDNIAFLIDSRRDDAGVVDSPAFKKYSELQVSTQTEYDIACTELTASYIPECLKGHQYEWLMNFAAGELEVTIKCDCGVQAFEQATGI